MLTSMLSRVRCRRSSSTRASTGPPGSSTLAPCTRVNPLRRRSKHQEPISLAPVKGPVHSDKDHCSRFLDPSPMYKGQPTQTQVRAPGSFHSCAMYIGQSTQTQVTAPGSCTLAPCKMASPLRHKSLLHVPSPWRHVQGSVHSNKGHCSRFLHHGTKYRSLHVP